MQHYHSALLKEPILQARSGADENHIWRDALPKIALQNSYLMHGILALSALHLAYSHPGDWRRYLQAFDRHQSVALASFREALVAERAASNSTALVCSHPARGTRSRRNGTRGRTDG